MRKKVICYICLAGLIVYCSPVRIDAAIKNSFLGKSKETIYVAVGSNLSLSKYGKKGKVSFDVSNRKVATIDNKCILKAKKKGKTYLTVKNKKTKKKEKIKVSVIAPIKYTIDNVSGTYQSSVTVKIKPKKGYKVYYSTNGKLKSGNVIAANQEKEFHFAKTTKLTVSAVKKDTKVSKAEQKKVFYKYVVIADEKGNEQTTEAAVPKNDTTATSTTQKSTTEAVSSTEKNNTEITQNPATTGEEVTTAEGPTSEGEVTTEKVTTTQKETTTQKPATTQTTTTQKAATTQVTTTQKATTTQKPATTQTTTTQKPATTQTTTTQKPATTQTITTTQKPATTQAITTTQKPTTTQKATTTEKPATTQQPTTTQQPATTEATKKNLLQQINNASVTPENLGVAQALITKYGSNYDGRNIFDMKTVDGKVMIATGDYSKNTGPTPIWYYTNDKTDPVEAKYLTSSGTAFNGGLGTEAILRFTDICGETFAVSADPLGTTDGSYFEYSTEQNAWVSYQTLPQAVHMFDIAEYDDKIFFSGMMSPDANKITSCIEVLDKQDFKSGKKATPVYFYKADGTQYQPNGAYSYYWRAYDLIKFKGDLYAVHSTNARLTTASGLFKYDKENNRFVQVYDGTAKQGIMAVLGIETTTMWIKENDEWKKTLGHYRFEDNEPVAGRYMIGNEWIYGDQIIPAKFSTEDLFVCVYNGIFKSKDLITFEKVSLGVGYENYVTRDAFELDGKYYFLASQRNEKNDYTAAVFETDKNFEKFRKVIDFKTQSFPKSFTYNDGYLYFGLGWDVSDMSDGVHSGEVLRINLENVK